MGGNRALEEGSDLQLDWTKLSKVASKKCDVVPVVVQDSQTGNVLICAYANQIALSETFDRNVACLWSTSRNELWVKGATSGDTLDLDQVLVNCEQNSLVYKVTPRRKGACHTKDRFGNTRVSCYYRTVERGGQDDGLLRLRHFYKEPDTTCPVCPDDEGATKEDTGHAVPADADDGAVANDSAWSTDVRTAALVAFAAGCGVGAALMNAAMFRGRR